MPYGERWKAHRALFHKVFTGSALQKYHPEFAESSRTFLNQLLDTPDRFMDHLRHMAGMSILSSAYGIQVQPNNDPYVELARKAMHAIACAGNPGSYLVDSIPALKYLPAWFPGGRFQTTAKEWRAYACASTTVTMDYVKKAIVSNCSLRSRMLNPWYFLSERRNSLPFSSF